MKTKELKAIMLRVDPAIYEAFAKVAEADSRSVNNMLVLMMKRTIQEAKEK